METTLQAAFQLHGELINDDAHAGYDGSVEQFRYLLDELEAIEAYEIETNATVQDIVDRFYEIELEIEQGEREAGWYQ